MTFLTWLFKRDQKQYFEIEAGDEKLYVTDVKQKSRVLVGKVTDVHGTLIGDSIVFKLGDILCECVLNKQYNSLETVYYFPKKYKLA